MAVCVGVSLIFAGHIRHDAFCLHDETMMTAVKIRIKNDDSFLYMEHPLKKL